MTMALKKTIKKATSTEAVVVRGTTTVRIFTKEKNGKDFAKLAESFAKKHHYEVKAG